MPIHTKWQIRDSENGKTILTKDLEIHIIEMPKIKEKLEEGSLKKWILFLENPEGEETKKMAENEKEIKEAIETLEEISSDEAKERMAELRQKYIMDRAEELETAEEKGMKKGIARGKEEGVKIGIARGKEEGVKIGIARGKEEGVKIGIIKGKEEGIKEGKIAIAKEMKKEKISLEKILKITGLSKEEIENI